MLEVVSSARKQHFLHTLSHSCGGKPEGCCRFNWVSPKYPSWNASLQRFTVGSVRFGSAPKDKHGFCKFFGSSNLESSVSKRCDMRAFPFSPSWNEIPKHLQLTIASGKSGILSRGFQGVLLRGEELWKLHQNLVLSYINITGSVHRTRELSDL